MGVARKELDLRLGVSLPYMGSNPDPQRLASVAQEAERLDFDSVWVPDHVLRVFAPILDPLTPLSFVAGATQSIGLGTNVLTAPYPHPVLLATGPLRWTSSRVDGLSWGWEPGGRRRSSRPSG